MSEAGVGFPSPADGSKCRACRHPMDGNIAAVRSGYCKTPACEAVRMRKAADAILRREWDELRNHARMVLTRAAPAIAAAAEETGRPVGDYALMAIPHEPAGQVELTVERRADFLAHLDRSVEDAFRRAPAEPPSTHRRQIDCDEGPLIEAACTTCKGHCCRPGADHHGFVNADTIRQYRAYRPHLDATTVRNAYAARLPERHTEGSCIFHGARGCTLDRRQRGEICNIHLCRPIRFLLETGHGAGEGPFLIVASGGEDDQAIATYSREEGLSAAEPGAERELSVADRAEIARHGLAPLLDGPPLVRRGWRDPGHPAGYPVRRRDTARRGPEGHRNE